MYPVSWNYWKSSRITMRKPECCHRQHMAVKLPKQSDYRNKPFFFFSQILDRDLQPHSLPMQTFYRSYRWQKFHAGQWPCHPRSLFSGLTLRSTTLHRHPDHWLIFLSLSPRSHRHNLTCQIAAYCRQRHCPNWCDATFAVPHQFPKVVPTLLLAISIDIHA